jgi:hypothetical protein
MATRTMDMPSRAEWGLAFGMEVARYGDPVAFRRDGGSVLLADVARNNLVLGTLQVLVDEPKVYPVFRLWLAVRGGRPVGVAMQTEPYNVLLAEPLEEGAVEALAEAVVWDGGPLRGITANLPWADRFAKRVATLTCLTRARPQRGCMGACDGRGRTESRRSRSRRNATRSWPASSMDPSLRGRGASARVPA